MSEHQASRTLLKSPPELWAECSDAQSLARHLDDFGEIRITRLEPEQAVAWEGERVSGTVKLEPSGWGTKVTMTAVAPEAPAPAPPTPTPVVAELERAPSEPVAVAREAPPAAPEPRAAAPEPRAAAPEPRAAAPEPRAAAPEPDPPGRDPVAPEPVQKPVRMGFLGRIRSLFSAPSPPEQRLIIERVIVPPRSIPEAAAPAAPPPVTAPVTPEPEATASEPPPRPEPAPEAAAALAAALDSLGKAHHRPFSRG
jgi:hypothetical protein